MPAAGMAVNGAEHDVDEGVELDGDGGDAGIGCLVKTRILCMMSGCALCSFHKEKELGK